MTSSPQEKKAAPNGLSRSQDRLRRVVGRAGWHNIPDGIAYAVIGNAFVLNGFARVVKHRDHTQTFELTATGRAYLVRQ